MEIVSSQPMRDVALSRARMIGTISSFGHHLSQIQNTEEPREPPSSSGPGRMNGPVVQVPTHRHMYCAGPQVPINRFAFPDMIQSITVGRDREGNRMPEFGLLRDKRLAERDRQTHRERRTGTWIDGTFDSWKLMVPTPPTTDLLSTTPVSNPPFTRRPALTGKGSIYEK
ncbi:hypothetical protein ASPFODRAFT_60420 [Aspergillus luchuensis CBS 106.47]|uniref:Uncharacterized protein n=1 Tax=Aspergillus luchuensis (strain CBS 106.47) TaxID=1137211 RepID=A0A1M3TI90_ASPLC|nr:hypothetical protein ASPFODRAFT_60420 [Aspergillus luchuensis CBS 106.47]